MLVDLTLSLSIHYQHSKAKINKFQVEFKKMNYPDPKVEVSTALNSPSGSPSIKFREGEIAATQTRTLLTLPSLPGKEGGREGEFGMGREAHCFTPTQASGYSFD